MTIRDRRIIIKPYNFSNLEAEKKVGYKRSFLTHYKEYIHRDFLSIQESTLDEFIDFFQTHKRIIAKDSSGSAGKNMEIFDLQIHQADEKLYHDILQKYDVIEEIIVPHPAFNAINPTGFPTIRLMTFMDDDGNIDFLDTASLIVGHKNPIVNISLDSIGMMVDIESGVVYTPAIDSAGNIYTEHPVTGNPFKGFEVPYWNQVLEFTEEIALKSPDVRFIGWDIGVTESGPVVIEGNTNPGIESLQAKQFYEYIQNEKISDDLKKKLKIK